TRRAISCAYCAPKSTTRTVSKVSVNAPGRLPAPPPAPSGTHTYLLGTLELLAFGLQGRGHHDLGLLKVLHAVITAGGHRRLQRAEQVELAVVLVRGTDEDLLEAPPDRRLHPRATRQRRMERGHAPVVALARRFVGRRERRADHHRVGAAGDGLGDVATGRHA